MIAHNRPTKAPITLVGRIIFSGGLDTLDPIAGTAWPPDPGSVAWDDLHDLLDLWWDYAMDVYDADDIELREDADEFADYLMVQATYVMTEVHEYDDELAKDLTIPVFEATEVKVVQAFNTAADAHAAEEQDDAEYRRKIRQEWERRGMPDPMPLFLAHDQRVCEAAIECGLLPEGTDYLTLTPAQISALYDALPGD